MSRYQAAKKGQVKIFGQHGMVQYVAENVDIAECGKNRTRKNKCTKVFRSDKEASRPQRKRKIRDTGHYQPQDKSHKEYSKDFDGNITQPKLADSHRYGNIIEIGYRLQGTLPLSQAVINISAEKDFCAA